MEYEVRYGESLRSIAARCLGDADRWPEIARTNRLDEHDRLIVGQRLALPGDATLISIQGRSVCYDVVGAPQPSVLRPATEIPARAWFFILADEVNPLAKKVVRKVVFPDKVQDALLIERIMHPERYGFSPIDPHSNVSVGRHVLGRTDSKYISASEKLLGAERFPGKRYWIDVDQVRESGGIIHDAETIARDLERIHAGAKDTGFRARIKAILELSRGDREVLIEGHVPSSAVKGPLAMGMTRTLQVVQVVGLVVTAYELGNAGYESYEQKSIRPISAELIRQGGGWAGAWAGATALGALGAVVGIESGPGAIITGLVGAAIGGFAGYYNADWLADMIHKN